ncbi:MAG: PAS domain-containing sensor histidine kinase [Candidatus Competibacteraceae bacterium]|nr:MAG: PAS domain-containing sensor histidine kinase [Candidatus Competibacteraceae bacterium]
MTRRRKVDNQMRQNHERYHQLFMDTRAVGLLIDPDSGAIVDANRMAVRYYGYSLEQLQQLKITDINILPPEEIAAEIQRACTEQRDCFLFRHRLASGEIRDVEVYSGPVDIDGKTLLYSIIQDITARNRVTAEREALQQQLVDASRLAGMTEVATGVLHNVGNALNSVNVSVQLINDSLRTSRVTNLSKTVHLLRENLTADLLLNSDSRYWHLLDYLAALAEHLQGEQQQLYAEVQAVAEKIDHIKRIVSRQQAYAVNSSINEAVALPQLLDDALAMHITDHHAITILRDYDPIPLQVLDKHKLLQIVANLIRNAKDALQEQDRFNRRLIVHLHCCKDQRLQIEITDTGTGIAQEHLIRVFEFGFTTKPNGHGFGLHSSANLARELGGALSCHSAGPGCGATFILELPLKNRPEALIR